MNNGWMTLQIDTKEIVLSLSKVDFADLLI